MKKTLGIAVWAGMMACLWFIAPLVAMGWNAMLKPNYVAREFSTEYLARIQRIGRIRNHHFVRLELDCAGETIAVRVLDLPEFDEGAAEFLRRSYPDCSNIRYASLGFFDPGGSWLGDWIN